MHYLLALLLTASCSYDASMSVRDAVRERYPCWATYEAFQDFIEARSKKQRQRIIDSVDSEQWRYVRKVCTRTGLI